MMFRLLARVSFLTALLGPAAVPARADEVDRLFDFTDAFYLQNGINPANISGRRQAGPAAVVDDAPFDYQRDLRALSTIPAYDHSGGINFFTVFGGGDVTLFTNNSAGRQARQLADASPEYVFPKQGADPIGLGNGRQSNLLDMRHGYFSNNPLGIWIHVWVNYTPKAFNTNDGRKELADVARKNGLALDGTPLIKSTGDIDKLFKKGLITKTLRPTNDRLRYAFCPVIEDPTDGGIAPDQFLNYVKLPNGEPLEPEFLLNFLSLQMLGDWYDD